MAWLNKVRTINMYVLVFAVLFMLQKYTIGLIPQLREMVVFQRFYFYEILFSITSLIIILLFVKAGPPGKN